MPTSSLPPWREERSRWSEVSVDYEAIRDEEVDLKPVFKLLAALYADRTHFIYELLQNAEDAEAKQVEYHLFADRLELRHDGRDFTERDVRAICRVGQSGKIDDLTKIGRFGIGFKSVYGYTDNPAIRSGPHDFRIEGFVKPHEVPPLPGARGWTTIVLPFDKAEADEPDAEEALYEISEGLEALNEWSLLFLENVRTVMVVNHDTGLRTQHVKRSTQQGRSRRLTITIDHPEQPVESTWLVWSRTLESVGVPGRSVEFAVQAEKADGRGRYEPVALVSPPIVVFFPTDKESHLGFLFQAPFRTTPSRDNVAADDATNKAIVGVAAELLLEMVLDLRDRSLLTPEFLETLPIDPYLFEEDSLLHSLHTATVEAFQNHELVPCQNGGHARGDQAVLARTSALEDLLTDAQLSAVSGQPAHWAAEDLEDGFRDFLTEVLDVDEVTPQWLLPRLTADFLGEQPTDWIRRLYEFLGTVRALSRAILTNAPNARHQPIIRLADGTQVVPYDDQDRPVAWLPCENPTRLAVVHPDTVASPEALGYLKHIGYREPDVIGDLCEFTFPAYRTLSLEQLDVAEHLRDVQMVCEALESGRSGSGTLRALVDETPFLIGVSPVTTVRALCVPSTLYINNLETRTLCGDDPDAIFVDADTYESIGTAIENLGVRQTIRPGFKAPDWMGHVPIWDWHGDHKRGLERFDPGAACPELDHALDNPTLERALWIWNKVAIPYRHLVAGQVERATRQDYSNSRTDEEISHLGKRLREAAWLPSGEGFVRPAVLELEDLPPEFSRNSDLAVALDMRAGIFREFSRETQIPAELLQGLTENPDLLEEALRLLAARTGARDDDADDAEPADEDPLTEPLDESRFQQELLAAFDRPEWRSAAPTDGANHETPGTVQNASLRRARTADEIEGEQEQEPPVRDRFQAVPRRKWERKKNATRAALQELYRGRCQICQGGFQKADGSPYFEGLYLVSYTKASWIDRLGNVLCLCATCSTKFQFGAIDAPDLLPWVGAWRTKREGGDGVARFQFDLCGETVALTFKERHLIDLQAMLGIDL